MTWNPDKYNEFKSEREQPFFDLIGHVNYRPDMKVIDLGCGTGELTAVLADRLTDAVVVGIDSSGEMLGKAPSRRGLEFRQRTIEEQIAAKERWDLIVSNAALQWLDDHRALFPKVISLLNSGGQFAVQMPQQTENVLNVILFNLANEEPFAKALSYWNRPSPVLTLDEYAEILFDQGGKDLVIYQKVYPIISKSPDDFFEFISGSALTSYLQKIDSNFRELFIEEFKRRIRERFPNVNSIYAFKRVILYAKFP
jgi:trans-aconitate 2-methyltransferase